MNTGAIITINLQTPQTSIYPDASIYIQNCPVRGYSSEYRVLTIDPTSTIITVVANQPLGSMAVTGSDLQKTTVWIPDYNEQTNNMESVLLWIFNQKPDSMLLSDPMVYPWLQDYALAFAKSILGQARGKFSTLAGPQGGTTLNGAALMAESVAEMAQLEDDLKHYVDGSQPLTWVIG